MSFKISEKLSIIRIIAAMKTERQGGPITNMAAVGFNSIIDDLYPSANNRLKIISAIHQAMGGLPFKASDIEDHAYQLENEQYEAANYKDYINEEVGFTFTLKDIKSAAAQTNDESFAVLVSACSTLYYLRFNTMETISFLLKADANRLAVLSQQAKEMHESFSTAIFTNINVNSHYEPLEETLELLMANKPVDEKSPLQKWWKYDDLLSESSKNNFRGHARFSRLAAIHGNVVWYPGVETYVKLKYELMLAGIVDSQDSTLNTRYENMVLHHFATDVELFSVAFDQIANHKPITDFVLPQPRRELIKLTTDVHSLERVIDAFKQRFIIDNSADVELKLAAFKENWPMVAKKRVLNDAFEVGAYPVLINAALPASYRFQAVINDNANLFVAGAVTGSLLLALVTTCYFKDRIGGMLMCGARGVGKLLSTVGLLKQQKAPIRLEKHPTENDERRVVIRQ
ncbi:MAG: hypothetical protein V4501_00880 [Pseudomonadota bacterium]